MIISVLAAYSLSASWALGMAGERAAAYEQEAAQLSAELDATRARLTVMIRRQDCDRTPESCLMGW